MTTLYRVKDNDVVLDETAFARYVKPASVSTPTIEYATRTYILKVKDLANDEKPREKLLANGPRSLSTQELIAVILGVGNKKEGVLEIASRISKEYGEKALAHQDNAKKMSTDMAISVHHASQLVAASELGRRFFEKRQGKATTIRTPQDVYDYVSDIRSLPKEHLRGIYLNAHHQVIHEETLSIGTATSSIIHPREVFKPAIEYGAVAFVLAHNHPSGIATPSPADIAITEQVIAVGKIIGINLIDHVIVTESGFESIQADY